MKIDILTLFPEMFDSFINTSIMKIAREKEIVEINTINIRDFTTNKHKKVDDYPFGGGPGMVMMAEPVYLAVESVKKEDSLVILMTPQGEVFNQKKASDLKEKKHLIMICGHYEGIDERIMEIVDLELSIGDYVLTGGEIPAMVITDSIVRLLDGVIEAESHENDSFSNGILDHPVYTRPSIFRNMEVPEVLLSGHHENIKKWRIEKAIEKTTLKRPDLLEKSDSYEEK